MAENVTFQKEMTVASVREREGAPLVEITFLESARFYKLKKSHPEFERLLNQLRLGMSRKTPLILELNMMHGDEILDVRPASRQ